MARIELIMPKLGESVMEATILSWEKKVGDSIELDENVLTIATDKVDTEVPSPVVGTLVQILFPEGSVVPVGTAIALIETVGESTTKASPALAQTTTTTTVQTVSTQSENRHEAPVEETQSTRFYSPLVKSIAKEEKIGVAELEKINGTGSNGRVTKTDMLAYLDNKKTSSNGTTTQEIVQEKLAPIPQSQTPKNGSYQMPQFNVPPIDKSNVEIIEMDRMRKLISEHMVMSKHVSPHVASFVECDVTNMVNWRNANKEAFEKKYGEKITYTPLFIEAVAKALLDFPMVNVSVEGTTIYRHKSLHIGMATALPSGNLIVPVIKNAQNLNLVGLTQNINDLANRARNNKLRPDDIQGGTFTVSNVGNFGSVMGLPIINQPQAAILALGTIRKKPAVIETEYGDLIAVRQMMFLSLSYDHRVVDGMLGGMFLRKIADYLEAFDPKRAI